MAFVEPLEYSCLVPVMGIIWALLTAALYERFLSICDAKSDSSEQIDLGITA